jgi:hypothetical protein
MTCYCLGGQDELGGKGADGPPPLISMNYYIGYLCGVVRCVHVITGNIDVDKHGMRTRAPQGTSHDVTCKRDRTVCCYTVRHPGILTQCSEVRGPQRRCAPVVPNQLPQLAGTISVAAGIITWQWQLLEASVCCVLGGGIWPIGSHLVLSAPKHERASVAGVGK